MRFTRVRTDERVLPRMRSSQVDNEAVGNLDHEALKHTKKMRSMFLCHCDELLRT